MDLQTPESLRVTVVGNDSSLTERQKKNLERALPLWKIVMNQFLEHRMAVVGLGVILFFVLIAFSADLIAKGFGLDPNRQNVSARYLLPFSRTEVPNDVKENLIENWIQDNSEISQALSKDVIDKCSGGYISRKKKLKEKQKEGKKRMSQVGNVEIPQKAFMSVLKLDEN